MNRKLSVLVRSSNLFNMLVSVLLLISCMLIVGPTPASAADKIIMSTSAQVFEAFQGEPLKMFTEKTGIRVEETVTTSGRAVSRLANGLAEVAATASRLDNEMKAKGFMEFPFCKDYMAVITNAATQVTNLTDIQVKGIFAGAITNWKQVGGPDKPIVVIIPGKDTAAYQNFVRQLMDGRDMAFDLMTSQSTGVVEATRRFPWSISFINQGATSGKPEGTKIIKVNNLGPTDAGYPYYEVFSLVTRGQPAGAVKTFVDHAYSADFIKLVSDRGMTPYKE